MSKWSFSTGEMSKMKLFLYLFALLGGCSHNRATANQEICRRVNFSEPSRGFALVGHVFANITLFIGPHITNHCRNRCIMEPKCRSINIGQVRKDKVLCQLSDSDQLKHPNDIKPMDDFLYLGIESNCDMAKQCEEDIDECINNPCHSGTCKNSPRSYKCTCPPEWEGEDCQTRNYCHGHKCLNGATCKNGENNYTCQCVEGSSGMYCEIDIVDECSSNPCLKGTCQDLIGHYSCVCPFDRKGGRCTNHVNDCFDNPIGVANPNVISNQQMTASSHLDESHQASHGRLNGTGWCAGNASSQDWLQIDFNRTIDVCAVATRGGADGWITKFSLLFSNYGTQWVPYEQEDGSIMHFDRSGKNVTIDQHKLPKTVPARHVRFIPNLQHVWNCLKVEVYGFDDPCYNHDVLNQAKRKKTFEGAGGQCDREILPSLKKWFRFVEPAGTQMPTACVPLSHCNAKRPGWLDGHHPNVTQGVVNMRVCFTSENDCCGDQKFISVKNCGDFFAYGLVKPRSCGRYCGE